MFSAVPRWPLWGALRRRGGRGAAGSAPLGEGPASAECRTCSWRSAGATAAMDSPAGALKLCLLRLRRRHHPAGGGTERGEGRLRVRPRPGCLLGGAQASLLSSPRPARAWPGSTGAARATRPRDPSRLSSRGQQCPKLVLEHCARISPIALWNLSIRESQGVLGATSLPPHTSA